MYKHNKYIIILIIIVLITYLLLRKFSYKSETILYEYSKRTSTNIITSIINSSINNVLINKHDKLIILEKNNNNEIISLDFNTYEINNILYSFNNNIIDELNSLESKSNVYYVPSGIIKSIPILIDLSPKIPYKINILGSTNNEIYTNIKDYGINNSMIEVGINIRINLQIILPFNIKELTIDKNILLDSKVIQGNIPEYYGNGNYLLKE